MALTGGKSRKTRGRFTPPDFDAVGTAVNTEIKLPTFGAAGFTSGTQTEPGITKPVDFKPPETPKGGMGGVPISTTPPKDYTAPVNTNFTGTPTTFQQPPTLPTQVVPKSYSPQDLYANVAKMMTSAPGTDLNTAYQAVLAQMKAHGGSSSWPEGGLWEYVSKEWARTHPTAPVNPPAQTKQQFNFENWQQANAPFDSNSAGEKLLTSREFKQKFGVTYRGTGTKPVWMSDELWGALTGPNGNDANPMYPRWMAGARNQYRAYEEQVKAFMVNNGPAPPGFLREYGTYGDDNPPVVPPIFFRPPVGGQTS
ncbi:MAG: hypothetical protein KKB31_07475 [Nanoarchaeota archaeon]|nr:hypothetical protein [Nanoarchaeota archaeon]